MKIYSMTATFGKLEHQTLTLQPGLNIIEAPNEWGKSTWCAFLVAMLYGIDTKARTTQAALADKEHYAPWSGAPMEGRMDICWNGKNITLERRTRGRLLFGDFRAYETETGLDVPELTAANCGMKLLGVEQSVFVRAGFLKMSDLPVTQDDALRRRLNNLVTTGDESGAGEILAQRLKELKNKCRFNRSGLIPQTEAEYDKLEEQLRSLQELNAQAKRLQERQQELEAWIGKLKNHKAALHYEKAKEDSQHILEALAQQSAAQEKAEQLERECKELPSEAEAERSRSELQKLHNESMSLQMEQQMLPQAPIAPACKKCFEGMSGEQAVTQAKTDAERARIVKRQQKTLRMVSIPIGLAAIILALLGGFILPHLQHILFVMALGMLFAFAGCWMKSRIATKISRDLTVKYGEEVPDAWISMAEEFAGQRLAFEEETKQYQQTVWQLQSHRENLMSRLESVTGGEAIGVCMEKWEKIVQKWRDLGDARRDLQRADSQVATLRAMKKDVAAPTQPDELTHTLSETETLLTNAAFEQKQNQLRLGQFQGQADALGQESALLAQRKQLRQRIDKLEETYRALELAQNALQTATSELQRRFAPRISKRAQELFGIFTHGRYEKMMLAEDLSVRVSAQQEDTMRSTQWRSDGTVDQLYLALRLAVAEELTPEVPLVLDDAMVRFDDARLKTALHILQEMAEHKQVILFTCQGREKMLQGEVQ